MRDFSDLNFRFLEGVLPMLTARVLGVMAYQKSQDFALKLNLQNEELHQKSIELTYQSDELKEYNLELEMQKKQLDEANRLKSAFLSNMSHELRTPLNSVIALSGVLTKRLKGAVSEDEYNYLGIIERNGRNLLELINDILDLSRIEAGKESVIMSEFSLLPVFEFIIDSVMPTAMNKNLKVVNRINPRLRGIVSDHAKCIHIFQNIFSNAVKFTEEGSIEINAEVINGEMVVSIKDTGIGISKENLPYIFDEFRQADDQTSRRYGGTGLGLAISKKYTQLLDGTIEVFSQPGEGSEFIVKLPMNPAGEYDLHPNENRQFARQTPDPRPPVAPKELSGKSLLLVEDSEPQIIQMMDILSEAGFPVRVARNGSEALAEIGKQLPDAIILDLMMPEVDGFEVLKQIRLHKDTSKIPVLILSAKYITKEELSFLKENHIYQLIQKGDINKKDLLMHITNMVLPLKSENRGIENLQQPESPEKKDAVILVVEDNEDNIASITALLGERYPVHIARNGADGLELARRLVPDLILLDVSLPLLDGTEVLKAIKTEPETGHIPVIVLTARAMKGDREALLDIGFDDYISKPIDNDYFNSIIKKWLNGR
jgi:signal transduction histidine kinase/DNA-binding response OmpR family regulator